MAPAGLLVAEATAPDPELLIELAADSPLATAPLILDESELAAAPVAVDASERRLATSDETAAAAELWALPAAAVADERRESAPEVKDEPTEPAPDEREEAAEPAADVTEARPLGNVSQCNMAVAQGFRRDVRKNARRSHRM
jgi:hypothetical protein